MTHWTARRRASLAIHTAFVSVPFTISTVSALLFWRALFDSWWLAISMVVVVEVLALTGLVLHIARVPSPFTALRRLLPFISIIPLGRELYLLLAHNALWVAWSVTGVATAILVVIAWKCFTTIEALFIDPVEAAREQAREQVANFKLQLAKLEEMNMEVDRFAVERMRYHAPTVTVAHAEPKGTPALTEDGATFQPDNRNGLQSYRCGKCGANGFSFDELGRHSRACKESI